MKTISLRKPETSHKQIRTQNGENYWTDAGRYFNELGDLTRQNRQQVESNPPPAIVPSIVAAIEAENNRL
jgi:hypothetical protein